MITVALFATLIAQPYSAPRILALDVRAVKTPPARSIVMTCYVPNTNESVRFFYSRTRVLSTTTEVRTWFGSDGSPMRSIQSASNGIVKSTADAKFEKGKITITRRDEKGRGRLIGFPTKHVVQIPEGAVLRGGIFDPMLLDGKPSTKPLKYHVLNPWISGLEKYQLTYSEKLDLDGSTVLKYLVEGPNKESTFYLDQGGFLKNVESDGSVIIRTDPTNYEVLEMENLASSVRMP